ncbi:MAG: ATP-binding protein [Thermoleophilia bacterium]
MLLSPAKRQSRQWVSISVTATASRACSTRSVRCVRRAVSPPRPRPCGGVFGDRAGAHRPRGRHSLAAGEPPARRAGPPGDRRQPAQVTLRHRQRLEVRPRRCRMPRRGGSALPAPLVDRLVHHAEVLVLRGDSYRLKGKGKGELRGDEQG